MTGLLCSVVIGREIVALGDLGEVGTEEMEAQIGCWDDYLGTSEMEPVTEAAKDRKTFHEVNRTHVE